MSKRSSSRLAFTSRFTRAMWEQPQASRGLWKQDARPMPLRHPALKWLRRRARRGPRRLLPLPVPGHGHVCGTRAAPLPGPPRLFRLDPGRLSRPAGPEYPRRKLIARLTPFSGTISGKITCRPGGAPIASLPGLLTNQMQRFPPSNPLNIVTRCAQLQPRLKKEES